jgi:hypothetical protein
MDGVTEEQWLVSRKRKVFFSFPDNAYWHRGPTHPPFQYFGGAVYPWVNDHDVKRKSSNVTEVKNRVILTLLHTVSWHTQIQIYFYDKISS